MRDPAIQDWPDRFAPASMSVVIDRPVFKGPKPLDGREQVVMSSAGGWRITYDGVAVYGDLYRQFRSIWLSTVAMAKPIYIKPEFTSNMLATRNGVVADMAYFDQVGTLKSMLTWGASELLWGSAEPLFWGNDATDWSDFQDGATFTQSTGDCYLLAAASRGAVSILVENSTASSVEAGDYFELDGRLHVVNGIDGDTWSIWPPLRANYSSGATLEIDDPRLLAYVVTDSNSANMPIQNGGVSRLTIDFIEANW